MKKALHDHGKILHWMGAHHLFPVRGASDQDLAFAHHGELEGRTPIGWNEFFPALARHHAIVVVDDESGEARVLPEAQALAELGPAAKEGVGARQSAERGSDATQDTSESK